MALTRALTAAAAAEFVSLASFVPAALAWEPKKPVVFVIMAGEGGGADQMARLTQAIIDESQFSPHPFIPVNKGGGSGAEALI